MRRLRWGACRFAQHRGASTAPTLIVPPAQDDLYNHMNAAWLAGSSIPPDQKEWGTLHALTLDAQRACAEACEALGSTSPAAQLYRMAASPRTDPDPALLQVVRDVQQRVHDFASYQTVAAELHAIGVRAFFTLGAFVNARNPSELVPSIEGNGLGLPGPVAYRNPHAKQTYTAHLAALLRLHGVAASDFELEMLFGLEANIAGGIVPVPGPWAHVTLDHADAVHDLPCFFAALGLDAVCMPRLVVESPVLLRRIADACRKTPAAVLRLHLVVRLLLTYAAYGHDAVLQQSFAFSKALTGQRAPPAPWQRGVAVANQFASDEVARAYAAQHLAPGAVGACRTLVEDVRAALAELLRDAGWVSPATQAGALAKLERMTVHVGVPEEWHSIDGLWPDGLEGKSLTQAAMDWHAWDWREQEVKKFYTPPDRRRWPAMVQPQQFRGVSHLPEMNAVYITAATLRPPLFDPAARDGVDVAGNYGALGWIAGHEMSHAFDPAGRRYNAAGKLEEWWAASDNAAYERRTQAVRQQYQRYRVLGRPINADLTLNENIADVVGIRAAAAGLRRWWAREHGTAEAVPRDAWVRFFTGFATTLRSHSLPAVAASKLTSDPHAPPHVRVNGAAGHVPEFYETYGVQPGHGMWLPPEQRVSVW